MVLSIDVFHRIQVGQIPLAWFTRDHVEQCPRGLLAKYMISTVALVQDFSDQLRYSITKFFKVAVGVETIYNKTTTSIRVNMHPDLHMFLGKYLSSMAKQHQEHKVSMKELAKEPLGWQISFTQKHGYLTLDLMQS